MDTSVLPCSACAFCHVTESNVVCYKAVQEASRGVGQFIATHIKRITPCASTKSLFDAPTEPLIGIVAYFDRVCMYSQATPESIVCALITLRKVTLAHPSASLTNFNAHRLLITALMVYAKYYDDEMDSNARWARIAGVPIAELNSLEIEFLNLCQFDLHVTNDEFHSCVHALLNLQHHQEAPITDWSPVVFTAPASCPRRAQGSDENIHAHGVTSPRVDRKNSSDAIDNESCGSHGTPRHSRKRFAALLSKFHRTYSHSHHSQHEAASDVASRVSSSTEHYLVFHPEPGLAGSCPMIATSPTLTQGSASKQFPRTHSLSSLLHTLSPVAKSHKKVRPAAAFCGTLQSQPQLVK